MGKIRRLRQKYHLARAKSMNDISTIEKESPEKESDPSSESNATLPGFKISSSLFDGIDIPLNCNQSLLEEDARSIITTKSSFKDRNLTKLQKRNLRHEAFMKKLDVIQHLKKEAAARKKRQRTAITGDMRPLADALPPLELITTDGKHTWQTKKQAPKRGGLAKAKQRQKNMLEDITSFRKVLADPAFKTDPTGAISNYIQEKIQMELMDEA